MAKEYKDLVVGLDIGTAKVMVVVAEVMPGGELKLAGLGIAPSNGINPALYVSNGYVILMPDIAYTVGAPGKDALDAVMPAIDTLVKQGFIDEKAIGIQGHSWGGYQIAWMVTQTNRFLIIMFGFFGRCSGIIETYEKQCFNFFIRG